MVMHTKDSNNFNRVSLLYPFMFTLEKISKNTI